MIWGGALRPWSPEGYGDPEARPGKLVTVLTPRSTVNTLVAGYTPTVDASAQRTAPGAGPHADVVRVPIVRPTGE